MSQRDVFGHPAGLTVLFLTETWERFSYVAIRVLLVYYMIKGLHFDQAKASMIYGLYSGLAYLTPIFGGVISDRWLGPRRSIILGSVIMAAGHFMMVFPALLYPALAVICLGNGLFVPSLMSQVALLYKADDPRSGSAYNVYYVGLNLGALLAPIICGALGEIYGWHWGFGAAGIGMLIGLAVYLIGGRYLPVEPPRTRAAKTRSATVWTRDSARRLGLLCVVAFVMVLFRTGYEQIGNTVAVWIDNGVDRAVGAWAIPMTWFQSINSLLILFAMPLVILLWTKLRALGREPDALGKMAIGAAGLVVAYGVIAAVAFVAGGQAKVGWIWVVVFITLLTAAEMWVYPVGMSLFGRVAPFGLRATTMSIWGLSSFAGNFMAGWVGTFWSRSDPATFFILVAVFPALAALLFLALRPQIRKLDLAVAAPQS
ncbi:MAG: peptide MFS transporter [Caulobacter sp.]